MIKELSYSQVPNLPQTTVKGHQGKFVIGELGNKRVLCLAGRVHGYEGLQMFELTFMARVLGMLGVKLFIATNASGGCAKGMYPGCLMIIRDHINFYHRNPLTGSRFFKSLFFKKQNSSRYCRIIGSTWSTLSPFF